MNYETAKRVWAKRRERIRAMVQKGIPPGEIARRFKISPSRVSHIMKRANGETAKP